jgi:hypothetical protein
VRNGQKGRYQGYKGYAANQSEPWRPEHTPNNQVCVARRRIASNALYGAIEGPTCS